MYFIGRDLFIFSKTAYALNIYRQSIVFAQAANGC